MFKRILVPVDGGEPSIRALEEALAMAIGRRSETIAGASATRTPQAALKIVHVLDDAFDQNELIERGNAILMRSVERAGEVGVAAESAMPRASGRLISDVILEEAKNYRADLIVLGSHGYTGMREALMTFLGTVAKEVIRNSTIPILLPGRLRSQL